MTHQPFHRLPAALASLLFVFVLLAPAQAMRQTESTPSATVPPQSGPLFLIRPRAGADGDYFTIQAEAGATIERTVVLGNAGDVPISLRTYAASTVPVINGGFSLADEDAEDTGTVNWIDYPAQTLDLAPLEGIERAFTVTIPEGTAPGQYIAGLVIQTVDPVEIDGSSLFNQIIRKSIAVFIIVPGPEQPGFRLGAPELHTDSALDRITVPVENTGNVLLKPTGQLALTNAAGETVLTAPIAMASVYAGMTVPVSVSLSAPIPDGDYTVSLQLSDAATGVTGSLPPSTIAISQEADVATTFSLSADVALQPDSAKPAFANVTVDVTNQSGAPASAELLLDVSRNGTLVETFPLAPSLALPTGATSMSQRYIPIDGWQPGTWTFVLRLNLVDGSGTSTSVVTLTNLPAFDIPGDE